jgi:DNA-binding response OmpR family regulator
MNVPIRIDLQTNKAHRGAINIDLSNREAELLHTLIERPTARVSQNDLIYAIYGAVTEDSPNNLRFLVTQTRRKIKRLRIEISNERKLGYRLNFLPA